MSRNDWICVGLIILGIILFLVGANVYNAVVGWIGLGLFVGGICTLIGLFVYNYLFSPKESRPADSEPLTQIP